MGEVIPSSAPDEHQYRRPPHRSPLQELTALSKAATTANSLKTKYVVMNVTEHQCGKKLLQNR